ncbi:MAG: hypothetical protein JWM89_1829 [Acidimicrobiales bacterium]|nr:hypothetical protein [Acidimicrobiales bacterium]
MATKFRQAHEVESIAEPLIEDHHRHLIGWRIEYLFRDKATSKNGKDVLGTARIIKGRTAFLARSNSIEVVGETGEILSSTAESSKPVEPPPFFVIEIALDTWGIDVEDEGRWGLSDEQRVALVDHELHHCQVDEDGRPYMRPHDIEEFDEILARYGPWKSDVRRFVEIAKGVRRLPGLDGKGEVA